MTTASSLALGFATIERPQVAQRLIRSVRKYLKSIPIYVADQSRDIGAMSTFYAEYDIKVIRMPFDSGVTASRNRLTQKIQEEFFVLCDDDFIIGPETDFTDAIRILNSDPSIGVVGGRLYDFDGQSEWTRNWEIFLEYDPRQRILLSVPIYDLAPKARELGGIRYYICDAVLNFAVMRRQMFLEGVAWDEQFKSNGEHEDFFLNLKMNTPYGVAYLPTLRAYHHHPEEYQNYRRQLRDRNDGWRRFLEKWGLDQHLEYGLGVKSIDDVNAITPEQETRARFFLNPDLSLHRQSHSADMLLVDRGGVIAAVGALDQSGAPPGESSAKTGVLLLDRTTGTVIALPERQPESEAGHLAQGDLFDKYQLESSTKWKAVNSADGEIYYRFVAVLRNRFDFIVWYYRDGGSGAGQRLAVVARWTSQDGSTLLWRSRRMYIDLSPANYWRPLLLEAPIVPLGARWLRFDIVTDGEGSADPVCSGFVFFDAGQPNLQLEALGITRLPLDGARPSVKGQRLGDLGRTARDFPVKLGRQSPDFTLLPLAQCEDLEVLFFHGWESMGRNLISARLPRRVFDGPGSIILPAAGWYSPDACVYGFAASRGLVRLRPSDELSLQAS